MGCTVSRPSPPKTILAPPPSLSQEPVTFFVKQQKRTNNYFVYQGEEEDEDKEWLFLAKDQGTSVMARAIRLQAKEDGEAVRSALALESYTSGEGDDDSGRKTMFEVNYDQDAAFEQDGEAHKPSKSLDGKYCSEINPGTRVQLVVVNESTDITNPSDETWGITLSVQARGAAVMQYEGKKGMVKSLDELIFTVTGSQGDVLFTWTIQVPDEKVTATNTAEYVHADWECDMFKVRHPEPEVEDEDDAKDKDPLKSYVVESKPGHDPSLCLVLAHICEMEFCPYEILDNCKPTFPAILT